ncbi:MAG: cell division protein FtsQ [Prevotella sp.]|nr:cell division protein FtsQ [Prevotella sp.]
MSWKKVVIIALDIVLAVYFGLAVTSFNKPDVTSQVCTKVAINIADETTNGFLSAAEIKKILERNQIYPLEKRMAFVDPRRIEDILKSSPFVNTAQCYTTQDGHVCINVTQRLPIVRIKSINGDDYYLDDKGGIMPNSKYTSDLIIASGNINKWFAQTYLAYLSMALMGNDLWRNLVEQIHVLPDRGIELVPRIGDNIVFMGYLPESKVKEERQQLINEFVDKKMQRLEKFYKYGLSEAGWNKYSYISLEFDNQIICKKKKL